MAPESTAPTKAKTSTDKKATKPKAAPARRVKASGPGKPAPVPMAGNPVTAKAPKPPAGKLGAVVALMQRPEGATVDQMSEATGWQAHSVRGALAGSLKKKHGLTITSSPGEGGRVYRIAADAPA